MDSQLKRWFLLGSISFSLSFSGLIVIGDVLLQNRELAAVVPLWLVWAFYLAPVGSIIYDAWRLLILEKTPWEKHCKVTVRGVSFLLFSVAMITGWIFTHSWAIVVPLVTSTVLYGLGLAKTVCLEILYPLALGLSILIELHSDSVMMFIGVGLIALYFTTLRGVRRRIEPILRERVPGQDNNGA